MQLKSNLASRAVSRVEASRAAAPRAATCRTRSRCARRGPQLFPRPRALVAHVAFPARVDSTRASQASSVFFRVGPAFPAVHSFSPFRVRRVSAWTPRSQSFPDSRQSLRDAFQRGTRLSPPRSVRVLSCLVPRQSQRDASSTRDPAVGHSSQQLMKARQVSS